MKNILLFVSCFLASLASISQADEFVFHHEHVLGTNLEIRVDASRRTALEVENAVLAEIERLNKILSGYSQKSEFSLWMEDAKSGPTAVSSDLRNVLTRAEHWRTESNGAFDIRALELTKHWKQKEAVTTNRKETRHEIISRLENRPYELTGNGIRRNDEMSISLDGLAKGFVLDSVCERISEEFDVHGLVINIGGDLRKVGGSPLSISILDPLAPDESNAASVISVEHAASVATSGGYFRNIEQDGKTYSHIFDPRSGLPVDSLASVTVIANKAIDADALATAVSVLGTKSGLQFIESLNETECLIISNDGSHFISSGWPNRKVDQANSRFHDNAEMTGETNDVIEEKLTVKFTLNRPKGRRYRRPYVAVWLEDEEGFPVKTGLLFLQTDQPGPRWHRDLTRWYRNDRTRKLVNKTDLIGTISSATRGPGEYTANFDGTDNLGKRLPDASYTLCLEVAREHGTYQIIREKIELVAGQPINRKELKSNVEVSKVSYSFMKPSPIEAKGKKASEASK